MDLPNEINDNIEVGDSIEECINCPYGLYENRLDHEKELERHQDSLFELLKDYSSEDLVE